MDLVLIYCYDAYCGWCYGFSTIIKRVAVEYKERIHTEVLSGGMILPERPTPIINSAIYIQKAYKTVEELTGAKFGEDYLWHIFNPEESDWFPNSLKPAIAMCIFKEYYEDQQAEFAADLQYAHHFEGRDLTDNESYRHLLLKYAIPVNEFYTKMDEDEYLEKAQVEFALVKQLKVTGFPTVFIQTDETRFYLVARGFTDYDSIKNNIHSVLTSIATFSSG
ncbi:MAG TPA: DsbA family protein [Flavitalea sp.]|nr:DsbA family protein [Flavitalea sp.]